MTSLWNIPCRFPNPSVLERFSPSQAALWTLIPILNVESLCQCSDGKYAPFGVNLSEGNYQTMLNYLFPVLALHWESHWQTRSVQKNRTCFTGDRFLSLQKPWSWLQSVSFLRRSICLPTRLPLLPVAFRLKVSAKFTDKELPQLCASVIWEAERKTFTIIYIQKNGNSLIPVFSTMALSSASLSEPSSEMPLCGFFTKRRS